MTSRRSIAWFILLIGVSASIFFFIRDDDLTAINLLYLSFYAMISVLYFLRILYYLDQRATLNEIYFFSLANIIPLGVIFISPLFPISQIVLLAFEINVIPNNDFIVLNISIPSLLAFPYLIISTALLIRSFTRYKFIRLTPYSERGPSAEWTAIITFFLFGIMFILVGLSVSDLISLLYGLFYLFSGIGFTLGR
jgi:hypothetical protein